jgi:hypothetical protein
MSLCGDAQRDEVLSLDGQRASTSPDDPARADDTQLLSHPMLQINVLPNPASCLIAVECLPSSF